MLCRTRPTPQKPETETQKGNGHYTVVCGWLYRWTKAYTPLLIESQILSYTLLLGIPLQNRCESWQQGPLNDNLTDGSLAPAYDRLPACYHFSFVYDTH